MRFRGVERTVRQYAVKEVRKWSEVTPERGGLRKELLSDEAVARLRGERCQGRRYNEADE